MKTIPPERFGKDHWSLLAYVECCCVDNHGELDKRRMRCHPRRHPLHNANRNHGVNAAWKAEYATRLQGFFDNPQDKRFQVSGHDDWDCLNDLEVAGFIEVISEVNALVKITPTGSAWVALARAHKSNGGSFGNFVALKEKSHA